MADLIERAYTLARSGDCISAAAIKIALRKEGFLLGLIEDHLSGQAIRKELTQLCRKSTKQKFNTSKALAEDRDPS